MITNNFKKILACALTYNDGSARWDTQEGLCTIRDFDGGTFDYVNSYGSDVWPHIASSVYDVTPAGSDSYNTAFGILLGANGDSESSSDYTIAALGVDSATFSCSLSSYTLGMDGSDPYIQFKIHLRNTSSTSVYIREIGYAQRIGGVASGGGSSCTGLVLFDRTVPSVPIHLPEDTPKTVTYTIKTILG